MRTPGYIYLQRKLLDNPMVCKDGDHLAIWIYFLLQAYHTDSRQEYYFNGERIKLKRGQFITGRKTISKALKIKESKVYRVMKLFQSCNQTEQRTDRQCSLITILNYDKYQKVNNEWTTSEQRVNTHNKYNKLINNKRESKSVQLKNIKDSFSELKKKFPDADVESEYDKFTDWMDSKGKQYKDYKAGFRNWLRRANAFQRRSDGNSKVEFAKTPSGLWKAYCSKCNTMLLYKKPPYPNTSSECCGKDIYNYDPARVSA